MKYVYSIKIRNSAVYYDYIARQLVNEGYNVSDTYINDFNFCPWLIVYYDKVPCIMNCNDGFYNNIKNNSDITIKESTSVGEFIENAKLSTKPNLTLF